MAEIGKSEHQYWIPHNQISQGTKFQFKLAMLIFAPNMHRKGISGLKQKWMNTIIEFCIFELA